MKFILILIIIWLVMQNPSIMKKVETFFHNFTSDVKKATDDVADQVSDAGKEVASSVKS